MLAGIGIGLTVILPTNNFVIEWYSNIALIPMIISCIFLSNVYFRFSKAKLPGQTVNKTYVLLNTVGFGTFIVGILLGNIVRYIKPNENSD